MATAADICQSALEDLGVLGTGQTMASGDLDICFKALNQLMDQYAAERLMIYTVTGTTWTIAANDGTYSVGATAPAGNVIIARPTYISHVNYRNTSTSPVLELPLKLLTDDEWANTPLKTLTSVLPIAAYYNPTYPLGTLNLWPVPTSTTLQGVLYAPQQSGRFTATSDTISLPAGYERFLVKSLALDVAAKFGAVPSPAIQEAYRQAKMVVKASNSRQMDMGFDAMVKDSYMNGYYRFLAGV
jgi:hypothetical protein